MIVKIITYILITIVSWAVLMIMIYIGLETIDFIMEKWSNNGK